MRKWYGLSEYCHWAVSLDCRYVDSLNEQVVYPLTVSHRMLCHKQ